MTPALVEKSRVPKIYARLAPIYDFWAGLTEVRARERCLELAQVRDGEAILEVACGTGLVLRELLAKNPAGRTVGVDVTDEMLARARKKLAKARGNWELRRGDAYALEFSDGEFDLVVNNYMFDLLPERDFPTVLAELRRVLTPGGRLVLVNMTSGFPLWDRLYRLSPALLGGCRAVELSPFLRACGFVAVEREVVSQLGVPSEILTARKP